MFPIDSRVHAGNAEVHKATKPPVLFVPGAFSGGWIWSDFMGAFFAAGHDVHTFTFSGHGTPRRMRVGQGLDRYFNDLRQAVERCGGAPIIVAHSLGGLTTLRLLAERDLPAAVLMAPVPPAGMLPTLRRMAWRDPISLAKFLGLIVDPRVRHLGAPPRGVYGPDVAPDRAQQFTGRLGAESVRALWQALGRQHVDLARIRTPVHLIAGGADALVPAETVRALARVLNASLRVYPRAGHTFQAEANVLEMAAAIMRWLDALQTGTAAGADETRGLAS